MLTRYLASSDMALRFERRTMRVRGKAIVLVAEVALSLSEPLGRV